MDPQLQQPQPMQPANPTQPAPLPPPQSPVGSPQQPTMTPAPASLTAPTEPSRPIAGNVPPQYPSDDQASSSDLKKIKILGYSLFITGLLPLILAAAAYIVPDLGYTFTNNIAAVFQALIGIGILKYSKIAMYAFNIFAALALVGVMVTLGFSWPFISAMIASFDLSLISILFLATFAYYIVVCAYIIWGLIVLHPKRVRRLFH